MVFRPASQVSEPVSASVALGTKVLIRELPAYIPLCKPNAASWTKVAASPLKKGKEGSMKVDVFMVEKKPRLTLGLLTVCLEKLVLPGARWDPNFRFQGCTKSSL